MIITLLPWLFFLVGLVLAWLLIIRPILRSNHFAECYFEREAGLLNSLKGFRTMIASWSLMIASGLVACYDFLAPIATGVDWHGLTDEIPPWAWPIIMFVIAALFAYLRKISTAPPAQAAPIIGKVDADAAP